MTARARRAPSAGKRTASVTGAGSAPSPRFDEAGLIPAVIQDAATGQVLMVAWMNREAYRRTLSTRRTHFWSRSRRELWEKGATSGHTQEVVEVLLDCDADTLLVKVRPAGPACHTGRTSCFFQPVAGSAGESVFSVLSEIEAVIGDRRAHPRPGSYTNYLLEQGIDKICKKIGEEAAEVIIAAKNRHPAQVAAEASDLLYHLLVALCEQGVPLAAVYRELVRRHRARPPRPSGG